MLNLTAISPTFANKAIVLARKHLGTGAMDSSARLCLSDAVAAHDAGNYSYALDRAKKSIAYSVGIMHEDYRKFN